MDIVTVGAEAEPILHKKAHPVADIDGGVSEFTQRMIGTMISGQGIGLAAPQVGDDRRIFVCRLEGEDPRVFINPEILETSLEEAEYEEGCLSVPGIYDKVVRPASVKVQAWNEKGKPFTLEAEGLLATVIQHETDHLNGVLFLDHLGDRRRRKILKAYYKRSGHTL